jgi:hypothetical protein
MISPINRTELEYRTPSTTWSRPTITEEGPLSRDGGAVPYLTAPLLDAHMPLWPQLVPAVPLWSNGRDTVQQLRRPGADWFRVAVIDRAAA